MPEEQGVIPLVKYNLAQSTINAVCSERSICIKNHLICIFMVQHKQNHCSIFRSPSLPVQLYSVITIVVLSVQKFCKQFSY